MHVGHFFISAFGLIVLILAVAALATEAWAFVDALRRPAGAFKAAGKLTKPLWLVILGVSGLIGIGAIEGVLVSGLLALIGILPVVGFVAAVVYHTDVKPKLKQVGRGGSRYGPYGPW